MTHVNTSILYKKKVANYSMVLLVATIAFGLFQARNELVIRFADLEKSNKIKSNRTYKSQQFDNNNIEVSIFNCTLLSNKNLVSNSKYHTGNWETYLPKPL